MATLRDHVEEEIEKAVEWANTLRERMADAGRGKYTPPYPGTGGGPVMIVGKANEKQDKRPEAQREFELSSIGSVRDALNRSHENAHGHGGWHDKTKSAKLKFAQEKTGLDKKMIDGIPLIIFPYNAWKVMNSRIRQLAKDIIEQNKKMHWPEYQIVVNAYTMLYYEIIGFKEEGSFESWRTQSKEKMAERIHLHLGY